MKLPSWKKIAALAFLAASPLMIASDEMETPCIDEETGLICWDIVPRSNFYYDPAWTQGPGPGQCFSCIHNQLDAVLGSTFIAVATVGTSTLTCTTGIARGTGGNRWCDVPAGAPYVFVTVTNWGGIGLCNGGNGCAWS